MGCEFCDEPGGPKTYANQPGSRSTAGTLAVLVIVALWVTLIVVAVLFLTWRKTLPAEALRPVMTRDWVALGVVVPVVIAVLIFVKRR